MPKTAKKAKSQKRPRAVKKTTAKKSNFSDQFNELDLALHGVRLPSFHIPKEEKRRIKISEDVDNYDFLRALCFEGFKQLKLCRATIVHQIIRD